MGEKLLVTQALDERDLLKKRIDQKISNALFIDYKKKNEDRTALNLLPEADFRSKTESTFQAIMDLIKRYDKLNAAILTSNANTMIHTESNGTMSVAAAITLRNRLKSSEGSMDLFRSDFRDDLPTDSITADFERKLTKRLKSQYDAAVKTMDEKNNAVEKTAETMRVSILGKENRGGRDDASSLAVVAEYIDQNKASLVDPLDIQNKIRSLREFRETLLSELTTAVKVSNATTFIELS